MKAIDRVFAQAAGAALAAAVLAVALNPAHAAEDSPSARHAADEAYAAQHLAAALARDERLAAQGDALAAERAGEILLLGSSGSGKQVPRDLVRAKKWLAQAARSGSARAALLLQHAESIEPGEASGAAEEPYVPGPFGC
jgi:TPR repeat protein